MTAHRAPELETVTCAKPRRSLHDDTRGLSTVEYIIILILIAVIAITAWKQFGESVEYHVRDSTTQINHLGD